MRKSLEMRRQKSVARRRDKRLLAAGKLRIEQISIAAAHLEATKSPLILPHIDFERYLE